MKFPRLNHPRLCQFILYLPALLPFIILLMAAVFLSVNETNETVLGVSFLACFPVVLIYLFKNAPLLICSDIFFAGISAWKKDRENYYTACNGTDRKTAEKHIIGRMSRCGKERKPLSYGRAIPLAVSYRRSASWMVGWAAIEKICLLYSVDFLDFAAYNDILSSARLNTQALQCKKSDLHFPDKHQKKTPVSTSAAVIILADRVAENIRRLVRNPENKFAAECVILPCIYDFENNRVLFDGMKEPFVAGMSRGIPSKNRAIKLIIKAVFGGRLPLKGNSEFTDFRAEDVNMSLWEYVREFNKEMRGISREEKRLISVLKDREVKLNDEIIYCKLGERTAAFAACVDDDGLRHVELSGYWFMPKKNRMSINDTETIKHLIGSYLSATGEYFVFDSKQ